MKRSKEISVRETKLLRSLAKKINKDIGYINFESISYHFPGKPESFLKKHYYTSALNKN
jgi:hypothetical protein